ncbi:MAG: NAD-binding protein, partial [Pseudomonadota bacterium]
HAFYFLPYTGPATGFGEMPYEFSNAQRLGAIFCLYTSVITWFYAIGSIVRLVQNPYFQQALNERNFAKNVKRIVGPYVILCGFGDTGSLLARGLSDAGMPAVIIEGDEARLKALGLRNYRVPMPGLCADASVPKHLIEAGLQQPNCKAVVAITNNEEVNFKIAAIARLLNPSVGIITLSKVDVYEETLATLGRNVHIVDPFKTFAQVFTASMNNPGFYVFNTWLVGAPGASLAQSLSPPRGKWVICGFGRMGHEVQEVLEENHLPASVIDPHAFQNGKGVDKYIVGRTTAKTLLDAGIEDAVGILVGTNDDGHNLGILLNARALNPNLFSIVRQNRHENEVAFNAANADMIMQPSLVTARRILFLLIAPLLKRFFRYLLEPKPGRQELMADVIEKLRVSFGREKPQLITIFIDEMTSKAVVEQLDRRSSVLLGDILRDPRLRERELKVMPFVIQSGSEITVLPENEYRLKKGDQILFCGTEGALRMLTATLKNEYALHYVRTGTFKPRGYFMQWYSNRHDKEARQKGAAS